MNWLEIIGTIVGIIYLILEYKANIYLWVAGIIMPAIYIFVYYDAGLYADFAINIYYLLVAVYGIVLWTSGNFFKKKKNRTEKKELSISNIPLKTFFNYSLLFIISFILIGIVLKEYTDSNVPWADSFTTALSIVGMLMLAKKYIEQWLVWIIVDVVCCVLYIYKGLYFTSALYGLYSIIAIFGYLKWKKLMNLW